jgi:hypothetical protein
VKVKVESDLTKTVESSGSTTSAGPPPKGESLSTETELESKEPENVVATAKQEVKKTLTKVVKKTLTELQQENKKNDFEETKSYRFTFGICVIICIFIPEMKEEQLNKKKLFISKKEFEDQQSISILNNHIRLIKFITNIILVYLLFLLFQLRFIDAINSILFTLKIIFPLFFGWYIVLTIWFRRFNINIIFRSSFLTLAIIGFLYFVAYVMFKIFNSLQSTIKLNVSTNSLKNLKLNADINVNP